MIRSVRNSLASLFALGLAFAALTEGLSAHSEIAGWGRQVFDSRWSAEAFAEIAAGGNNTVARRSDGSVVAWGDNLYGQCNVPVLPAGLSYVEIEAGFGHLVARRSDGSVVA